MTPTKPTNPKPNTGDVEQDELHLLLVAASIEMDVLTGKAILAPDVETTRPITVDMAKMWVRLEEKLDLLIAARVAEARQEPVGDAIEIQVDPKVMQHVLHKTRLKAKTIAKRVLAPVWLVERWLDGTGDQYDYEVYIWKLRILASLSGRYNWAVFLMDDVAKLNQRQARKDGDAKE